VVTRAKIVLLAAAGWENTAIAGRLDVAVQLVSKWRKRFSEEGLPGLEDRPRAQRLYLDFLEALELREETVPGEPGRGELVFYQLEFSQAIISDFEQVYFNTSPKEKYDRSSAG
jgi:transposase-like protein